MKENETFSELLDRLKVKKDITDVEAARLLGVGATYLSQIRTNKGRPSRKLFRKLELLLSGEPILGEESITNDAANTLVTDWCGRLGITKREFLSQCVLRYGQKTFDELQYQRQLQTEARAEVTKIVSDLAAESRRSSKASQSDEGG